MKGLRTDTQIDLTFGFKNHIIFYFIAYFIPFQYFSIKNRLFRVCPSNTNTLIGHPVFAEKIFTQAAGTRCFRHIVILQIFRYIFST